MRSNTSLLLSTLCIVLLIPCHAAAESAFVVTAGQRLLFLDEVGIDRIENLTRTLHPPIKKGAVIRPDYHRGIDSYQTRSAPMWDSQAKVYRFWINGRPSAMAMAACSYLESKDGLHWSKPSLGQVEYGGSRDNNLVSIMVQGKACAFENADYDPTDPDPTRRFKAIHRRAGLIGRLHRLVSNGVEWRSVGTPFEIRKGDEDNFSIDPVDGVYIATLRHNGGPYGRAVDLATSRDFETWTKHGLIFHADELDQELGRAHIEARLADPTYLPVSAGNPKRYNVDVYNMGVGRYESLYVGFPAMFHRTGKDGFHLIQLVSSRDLKHWHRVGDRKTFIGPSRRDSGAYDLTQIIGPSRAVVRGDELWFYYTGLKYRVRPEKADPDTGAICLAVLRRDGFISLDGGQEAGTLLTEPFKMPGARLFVNVDAPRGGIRVEMLDEGGKVMAASASIKGDHFAAEVIWENGEFAQAQDRQVRLRFTLANGQFYSYWVE